MWSRLPPEIAIIPVDDDRCKGWTRITKQFQPQEHHVLRRMLYSMFVAKQFTDPDQVAVIAGPDNAWRAIAKRKRR